MQIVYCMKFEEKKYYDFTETQKIFKTAMISIHEWAWVQMETIENTAELLSGEVY